MKSARSRPKTRSRTGDITEAPAAPDIVADGKLAKLSHLAHISLSPLNKMSLRTKRLFEQNLEGSIVKKKCTSLMSDSSMKVPVVRLHKLELDHQKRKHNEPTPDDGSVHSKLPPSPLAHNELLASNLSITNNQQNTLENVCTSPPKECSKVPVVRLFRLNMQTETEEKEPTSESDREKPQDQELQKTDKQKVPCANNSYTSLEGICRRKQPVVKLSRLKAQLHEGKLGQLSSEQYLDQVPSPSNTEALSPLAQSAILPPNTDFTRKRDQQKEDPENKGSASFETVCSKQPVVYLTRLNIETKNQCQATDEDDSEHHHDHVQSMQPEGQDEQPTDDSDSDQLDKEELKMSAYELERLKNIKDNAKFLKSLKFLEIPASLRQPPRKRVCAIRVKSQSDMVTRRSKRLQERTLQIKIPKKKNEIEEIPEQQPHGPIKMCPSNDVDHGAWISFQDTWKSMSTHKCAKPSKSKRLDSYTKSLQSLTLKKRAVTRTVPGSVCCLAIHPSKSRTLVATGDSYGNVGLWDLKHESDGVYVFPLHSKNASSIAFSPSNPQHLLSLGREGTIRCGDISCSVFDEIYYEEGYLTSFDFLSANGSVLVVSHSDSKLSVVDRRTRNKSYEVRGVLDFKYVRSVNVHPLKRDLCVVAASSSALIYDVRKLSKEMTQPVMSLLGHGNRVVYASFSPFTGKRILTFSAERCLRLNKKGNILPVVTWEPKQDKCFGHGLIGGGQIDILCVDGQHVHTLASTFSVTPSVLAIHPTRDLVVMGTRVGVVGAWKKWNNKENKSLE